MLKPADIAGDVRNVLTKANRGRGTQPHYLTAYQILERLPQRDQLIEERGMPGGGAGIYHAAASVIKDAILYHLKGQVTIEYFDNVGVSFEIAGTRVPGGYPVCGLYRLMQEPDLEA